MRRRRSISATCFELTAERLNRRRLAGRSRHGNPKHYREPDTQPGRCTITGRVAYLGGAVDVGLSMSDRDQFYPLDRRVWLLAIGRQLRVEYDAIAEPMPPHLAALVKQLEMPCPGERPRNQ